MCERGRRPCQRVGHGGPYHPVPSVSSWGLSPCREPSGTAPAQEGWVLIHSVPSVPMKGPSEEILIPKHF